MGWPDSALRLGSLQVERSVRVSSGLAGARRCQSDGAGSESDGTIAPLWLGCYPQDMVQVAFAGGPCLAFLSRDLQAWRLSKWCYRCARVRYVLESHLIGECGRDWVKRRRVEGKEETRDRLCLRCAFRGLAFPGDVPPWSESII